MNEVKKSKKEENSNISKIFRQMKSTVRILDNYISNSPPKYKKWVKPQLRSQYITNDQDLVKF